MFTHAPTTGVLLNSRCLFLRQPLHRLTCGNNSVVTHSLPAAGVSGPPRPSWYRRWRAASKDRRLCWPPRFPCWSPSSPAVGGERHKWDINSRKPRPSPVWMWYFVVFSAWWEMSVDSLCFPTATNYGVQVKNFFCKQVAETFERCRHPCFNTWFNARLWVIYDILSARRNKPFYSGR